MGSTPLLRATAIVVLLVSFVCLLLAWYDMIWFGWWVIESFVALFLFGIDGMSSDS